MLNSVQNDRFATAVHTLESLGQARYLIPTYQRPYVWQHEQVSKLISDFWSAYTAPVSHYLIGTIMTSIQENKEELVDGQQRFTTLWLIAMAFKNAGIDSTIIDFLHVGTDLRFDFAIRERLKNYLTLLINDKSAAIVQFPPEVIDHDEYLINIARALTTIEGRLNTYKKQAEFSLEGFGDFIYKKVQFVKNNTPEGINLNQLFATINNSGIQLEQTDILKANLLKGLKTEKDLYSHIWEACENMDDYFERNVFKIFPDTNKSSISLEDFKTYESHKFPFSATANMTMEHGLLKKGYTVKDIIKQQSPATVADDVALEGLTKEHITNCESIISFAQLLLHAYRGFLHIHKEMDFELPFHSKHLLAIFKPLESQNETTIKSFFKYLWRMRYTFDKHIVKWITLPGEKDKQLLLTVLSKDVTKGQFTRTPRKKIPLVMLQNVLYFTTNYQTQIWLSPFLKLLMENQRPLASLERVDNELSLTNLEDKTASYVLMNPEATFSDKKNVVAYLKESHGTSFQHYWFQKLEYILWKQWLKRDDPQFVNYRITSKNSIEHISPQLPEYGAKLAIIDLNSFGNLALLNVSQNSSYSNQFVSKKQIDFENKSAYDSLKLAYVYRTRPKLNWTPADIELHLSEMIAFIKAHYQLND